MQNEILINAQAGETRAALLQKGTFVELHIERDSSRGIVGNVVKGRVTRVLPGMQAAFVDIGMEKAAFLYAGDYIGDRVTNGSGDNGEDSRGRRRGRNGNGRQQPPKIDEVLSEGEEIVIQVAKEPIGTKGARITSHVSIAGRHLVLTPWSKRVGVSRRIDSDRERRRLREIVSRLRPADLGFITRTAGEGTREADLEADVRYLTSVWDEIQLKKESVKSPSMLYREPSLAIRVIRDFADGDTKRILVDSETVYEEMKNFVDQFVADPKPKIERYTGQLPIFDQFGIESQIDSNLGRKVWLKSGGYLIVDQSEALTAIDVNTGRFVGKHDLEDTVLKTNLEAVREIVNQLRFRNIGGLIICDLIDMEPAENRDKVYRAFQEALRQDKAKTNILKISELGLVEMTRKRTRENLVETVCEPCSYCGGRSYVLSRESVAFKVIREIQKDMPHFSGRQIAVSVNPRVAEILLGVARESVTALQTELGREIEIRAVPGLHQEQFEVVALDSGEPLPLKLGWLKAPDEDAGRGERKSSRRKREAAPEPSPDGQDSAPSQDLTLDAPNPAEEGESDAEAPAAAADGVSAPLSAPDAPGEALSLDASATPEDAPPEAPKATLEAAPGASPGAPVDDESEYRILRPDSEEA